MEKYNFNEEIELRKYNDTGSSKGFNNYCVWEEEIEKKYKDITDIQYLINLKAYLKKTCNQYETRHQAMTILWIPFLTLLISLALMAPSLFIGLTQYQDNIQSNLDSTYVNKMIENKENPIKITDQQVKLFSERIKHCQVSINYVMFTLYVVFTIIVVAGMIFGYLIFTRVKKITFYKDYINVIEKLIDKKTKLN